MASLKEALTINDLLTEGHINGHFNGVVACNASSESLSFLQKLTVCDTTFHTILLLTEGGLTLDYAGQHVLSGVRDLIIIHPSARLDAIEPNGSYNVACLLIDRLYAKSIPSPSGEGSSTFNNYSPLYPTIFHLDEAKYKESRSFFSQIESAIHIPHLYKKEIIRSLIYIYKAFIEDLDISESTEPHDYSHKENVFKIFIHLASTHFREHRQIDYYADRLCITNTYLSRIVREVSGKTVNNYLTQMLFEEACRQLTTTDTPLGQIAFDLNFSDQSAFSNFFKTKSAMTPKAFRAQRRDEKNIQYGV